MNIGIDARLFISDKYTGIGRSTYEIVKVWAKKYRENEYYLFSHIPIKIDFVLPENWHVIVTPWLINKGKTWEWFELPLLLKKHKIDKYWGTNFTLPRSINGIDYYVTIYDLAALKIKGIGTRKIKNRLAKNAKKSCKQAKRIIAISEASKRDIVELFGTKEEKITVSYCGGMPTDYRRYSPDPKDVNRSLVFDEPYFLFIGTIEPRKNIKTIIRAFEEYIDKNHSNEKLVLAGKRGWNCDDIYYLVENSRYRNRIVMPGFISDNDKAYLLSNAKMFLYPSLYEGFGIPVLEAFAYDIPVITAKVSSLPEVGGEAAYYIDNPTDYSELAKKMALVISRTEKEILDCSLAMQNQMTKFSWEKNAQEMIDLICEK